MQGIKYWFSGINLYRKKTSFKVSLILSYHTCPSFLFILIFSSLHRFELSLVKVDLNLTSSTTFLMLINFQLSSIKEYSDIERYNTKTCKHLMLDWESLLMEDDHF